MLWCIFDCISFSVSLCLNTAQSNLVWVYRDLQWCAMVKFMKVNRGQNVSFDASTRRLHIFGNHIVASSYCNLRSSRRLVVFDQPFRRLVVFEQPFRRLVVVFFSSSSRRLVGLLIRLSKPGSSPIFEEKWRPRRGEWKSLKVTCELALRIYYAVWTIGF